jgi:hypothetical protein
MKIKGFTTCEITYKNKKKEMCITNCYCKHRKKCKGFKYENK